MDPFGRFLRLLALAGGIVLMLLMKYTVLDVVLRYGFNRPFSGSLDLTEFAMAVIVFLGIAYCGFTGGHVAVDILERPLEHPRLRFVPVLLTFVSAVLFAAIAWLTAAEAPWLRDAAAWMQRAFDPNTWWYQVVYFLMVVFFTYFYTLVVFQQQNIAENLQKNGGFIPGIQPGRPTQVYLLRVLNRITLIGASFLGIVAILPFLAGQLTGVTALLLSSTALLIVVGVAIDTMRQLEAQLLMRHYEGFIK